ncbi:TetR/AcrR family transcriptional regulator [Paenibacillus provencensis]|uniref:TetR/AcrR family transcriptional regulator n=1 Tax=Paenibacillus provencensis TaxID=441151 RepID=A0ABW3PPK8_9BACL|nr:TetR/AcrR family transcriptional regulator [Paenibacillus sp. MER 78]MCM3129144.1 TetR/AcrR family transcriptional regulator [Paenibacillus sp. MER 78]
MSMISATAGISSGLLYYYFKSKDELFTSLVQEAMFETEVAIRSIYELPGTPIQKLRALTTEILDGKRSPLLHASPPSADVWRCSRAGQAASGAIFDEYVY